MKIARTVAAVASLLALIGAVSVAPSAVAKKAKKPKVSVQIKTSNQAALNSSKGVVVVVKSSRKATVTVKATGDGKSNAFKS